MLTLTTTKYQQLSLQFANNLVQTCKREVPALIFSARTTPETPMLFRTSPAKVRALALYVRNSTLLQFRTLVDIAVVDKLLPQGRFAVNYSLLSMTTNQRLTLQLYASETTTIPSLAAAFANRQRLFASAS